MQGAGGERAIRVMVQYLLRESLVFILSLSFGGFCLVFCWQGWK